MLCPTATTIPAPNPTPTCLQLILPDVLTQGHNPPHIAGAAVNTQSMLPERLQSMLPERLQTSHSLAPTGCPDPEVHRHRKGDPTCGALSCDALICGALSCDTLIAVHCLVHQHRDQHCDTVWDINAEWSSVVLCQIAGGPC